MSVLFEPYATPPDSTSSRVLLTFFGVVALSLLVTARCLEPAPEGFGTHRALGLPGCSFQMIFDLPCPSCGMTTSWALLTRGRFVESINANVAGFLLGLVTFVAGVWMFYSGVFGKWLWGFPKSTVIVTVLVSIVVVMLLNWIWQLGG